MDDIHIARGSERLGVFDLEAVREGLRTGKFFPNDLGWRPGMSNWTVLSAWPELSEPAPEEGSTVTEPTLKLATDTGADPAGAGGQGNAQPGSEAPQEFGIHSSPNTPEETGLPWENRNGDLFGALLATLKLVLLMPSTAFGMMKRGGGFLDPLSYVAIVGSVGMLFATMYNMGFQMIAPQFATQPPPELRALGATPNLIGMIFVIPMIPVLVVLFTFIGAGVTHLCLLLVGGAQGRFEVTFRVVSYAYGSTAALQVVPFCGGPVAGIWYLVSAIIGLTKAHDIPAWKSALAVLLPAIICCGIAFFTVTAIVAGLAGMSAAAPI